MEQVRRVDLPVPEEVRWIAERLESRGFEAWAIGGGVRDALFGGRPKDWDVTTSARPADVQRIFPRTAPVGIQYGTVGVIARSGTMYEVTTFRKDVETFGRQARVIPADTLTEDLERRDFTMNAIAWHPISHELRDPHNGLEDLRAGVLRTVGDPERRFEEDRLRVLRALRFAGRFDLRVEEATWLAVLSSADRLGNLSVERVREELWKVLSGQRFASRSLELYAGSGVLEALFPELARIFSHNVAPPGRLWRETLRSVDSAPQNRPLIRLTLLLRRVGSNAGGGSLDATGAEAGRSAAIARAFMRRLRFSNAEIDRVTHLVAQHGDTPLAEATDADLRRWIRRVGPDHLNDLYRVLIGACRGSDTGGGDLPALRARTASILRSRPALAIGDLPISGADLRAASLPPGPLYGEILNELLDRVIDDPGLNERETLLRLIEDRVVRDSG
jgi:tRNA nucleotidyltransferase (CCA-adding enzyme)